MNEVPKIQMDPDVENFTTNSEDILIALWSECIYPDMPRIFKFVLKYFSTDKNIIVEDKQRCIITSEWECTVKNYDKLINSVDIRDEWCQCICKQNIKKRLFIRSKLNGNILRVGNCCIDKIFDKKDNIHSDAKRALLDIEYRKYGRGNKKACKECGKHRIDQTDPKDYCGPCSILRIKNFNSKDEESTDKTIYHPNTNNPAFITSILGISKQDLIKTINKNDGSTIVNQKPTVQNNINTRKCKICMCNIDNLPSYHRFCTNCYFNKR
jgi:hypothetical protein